ACGIVDGLPLWCGVEGGDGDDDVETTVNAPEEDMEENAEMRSPAVASASCLQLDVGELHADEFLDGVDGEDRGIGQGLVQTLAREGYEAFGTVRYLTTDDHTFRVDLNDPDAASVKSAASKMDNLDLLIVNAAIADNSPYIELQPEKHRAFYNTNVIGPLTAAQAFLPAMRKGKQKTIVFITSLVSNLALQLVNAQQPAEKRVPFSKGPYPATKAALNLLGIGLYNELSEEGFSVLLIHPGLVRTDMAALFIKRLGVDSPFSVISVEESSDSIVGTIKSHIASGISDVRLLNYDGTELVKSCPSCKL
ncbi:hypothetical protein A4X06_0g8197, partial [Tilletia controversa]